MSEDSIYIYIYLSWGQPSQVVRGAEADADSRCPDGDLTTLRIVSNGLHHAMLMSCLLHVLRIVSNGYIMLHASVSYNDAGAGFDE